MDLWLISMVTTYEVGFPFRKIFIIMENTLAYLSPLMHIFI